MRCQFSERFNDARGLALFRDIALDQQALDTDLSNLIGRALRLFRVGAKVQRNVRRGGASSKAIARPMPREEPVTSATLPAREVA